MFLFAPGRWSLFRAILGLVPYRADARPPPPQCCPWAGARPSPHLLGWSSWFLELLHFFQLELVFDGASALPSFFFLSPFFFFTSPLESYSYGAGARPSPVGWLSPGVSMLPSPCCYVLSLCPPFSGGGAERHPLGHQPCVLHLSCSWHFI